MNVKEVVEWLTTTQLRNMVLEKLSYNELIILRNRINDLIEVMRRTKCTEVRQQLEALYKTANEYNLTIIDNKCCLSNKD